jgi:cytochrome c oxidase subunit 2
MADTGARLFARLNCATCHSDPGKAPLLAGNFGSTVPLAGGGAIRADEAYLRESILAPRTRIVAGYPPTMPAYQGQLTETQVLELIAYLKSLPGGKGDVR